VAVADRYANWLFAALLVAGMVAAYLIEALS